MKTKLRIKGNKFLINDKLTYQEIGECKYQGILMNARFIQGVFDETEDPSRFNRFGRIFDPCKNTDMLLDELQDWYDQGLRGITVGFQGGGPCFTTDNKSMTNHPYKTIEGRLNIDNNYKNRMLKILDKADEIGMVVIISCFYPGQVNKFKSGEEIIHSLKAVCDFINLSKYENIILEICNEFDLCRSNPLIGTHEGMCGLITLAQDWLTKDIPVGSSLLGGNVSKTVAKVSDLVIVHGNECSPQAYYSMIQKIKDMDLDKPILCNEDSQCLSNMKVSMSLDVGWGYYNNMTKQEPPTDWSITEGEDRFFADRMAMLLGIKNDLTTYEEKTEKSNYYLQGVNEQKHDNYLFIRLASLYPETIEKVEFYKNDKYVYCAYSEPFSVNFQNNWKQLGIRSNKGDIFKAMVYLVDGKTYSYEEVDSINC